MKKLWYRCLRRFRILKHLNLTSSIKLNGRLYWLPLVGEVGLGNILSLSEPWMMLLLKKLFTNLDRDKTFIDVGANIGQTLLKVKSIDTNIRYLGFEPNPVCVAYLNQLIKENNFTETEILPVAIGNRTSIRSLHLYSEECCDASASIVDNFRIAHSTVDKLNVPVFHFSDLCIRDNAFENIGIIKIDVEGAELEVLSGLIELVRNQRPLVLLEVLPVYSAENESRLTRQLEIQDICHALEYVIFQICKMGNDFGKVTKISEFGIHADVDRCDYLLCPVEVSDFTAKALNY